MPPSPGALCTHAVLSTPHAWPGRRAGVVPRATAKGVVTSDATAADGANAPPSRPPPPAQAPPPPAPPSQATARSSPSSAAAPPPQPSLLTTLARAAFPSPRPPAFPPGPPTDIAPAFLADPLATLDSLTARYGPVIGARLGGAWVVLVGDGPTARDVLVDRAGSVFGKAGTAFFPSSAVTGDGLLTSDGESWRRQRQLAAPAFRRAAVEAYGVAMADAANGLVDPTTGAWGAAAGLGAPGDAAVRDVYADFNALTLRIVTDALFGGEAALGGPGAAGRVTAAVAAAFDVFARRVLASNPLAALLPEWVPTPDNVRLKQAVADLDAVVYDLIRAERARQERGGGDGQPSPPPSLLSSILSARDEAGGAMTDTQARDEVVTMLVAGQETSAIALGWTLALLAHHPAAAAAAAAEVDGVLGGSGGLRPVRPSDVGRMPTVEAALLEGLRLLPPAYIVGRCAAGGVSSGFGPGGAHALPPGTTLLVSPWLLHRAPAAWGQSATQFRPERWLPLLGRSDVPATTSPGPGGLRSAPALSGLGPNGHYAPFGAGPRVCIGAAFSLLEGVAVLAAALSAFEFEPESAGAPFPDAAARITLRPEAVRLRLRRRRRRVE